TCRTFPSCRTCAWAQSWRDTTHTPRPSAGAAPRQTSATRPKRLPLLQLRLTLRELESSLFTFSVPLCVLCVAVVSYRSKQNPPRHREHRGAQRSVTRRAVLVHGLNHAVTRHTTLHLLHQRRGSET